MPDIQETWKPQSQEGEERVARGVRQAEAQRDAQAAPPPGPVPGSDVASWAQAHQHLMAPQDSHEAVIREPPQALRLEGEPSHFVTLHTGVGTRGWRRGDVIPASAFVERLPDGKEQRLDVARLVEVGAIRPASEQEASLQRVTLVEGAPSPTWEALNAEQARDLAGLRAQNAQLREELRLAKGQAGAVAQGVRPQDVDALRQQIAEKDRVIGELQQQVRGQQGQPEPQAPPQPEAPPPEPDAPAQDVPEGEQPWKKRGKSKS